MHIRYMKCVQISQSHEMHYQESFAWFITQILFLQGCMKCHQVIFPRRCMNYHFDILQRCISTKAFDILQRYTSNILSINITRINFISTRSLYIFLTKILVPQSTQLVLNKDTWSSSSIKVPVSYLISYMVSTYFSTKIYKIPPIY